MSKTIGEILMPKPVARPRIYAYSIDDKAHLGLLKVGQTTRNVKQRIAEQLKTAGIKNYKISTNPPHATTVPSLATTMCARHLSGRSLPIRNWNGCAAR